VLPVRRVQGSALAGEGQIGSGVEGEHRRVVFVLVFVGTTRVGRAAVEGDVELAVGVVHIADMVQAFVGERRGVGQFGRNRR
jgi:hypothetical protein